MRARREWGFVQYDDFESAVLGERDLLPRELPTFVGGAHKVDLPYLPRTRLRPFFEALTNVLIGIFPLV